MKVVVSGNRELRLASLGLIHARFMQYNRASNLIPQHETTEDGVVLGKPQDRVFQDKHFTGVDEVKLVVSGSRELSSASLGLIRTRFI